MIHPDLIYLAHITQDMVGQFITAQIADNYGDPQPYLEIIDKSKIEPPTLVAFGILTKEEADVQWKKWLKIRAINELKRLKESVERDNKRIALLEAEYMG